MIHKKGFKCGWREASPVIRGHPVLHHWDANNLKRKHQNSILQNIILLSSTVGYKTSTVKQYVPYLREYNLALLCDLSICCFNIKCKCNTCSSWHCNYCYIAKSAVSHCTLNFLSTRKVTFWDTDRGIYCAEVLVLDRLWANIVNTKCNSYSCSETPITSWCVLSPWILDTYLSQTCPFGNAWSYQTIQSRSEPIPCE